MTVHPPKGLSKDAHEQATQAIEDGLEDLYGEDTGGYAERTVQLPRGTASYTEGDYNAMSYTEEVCEAIPEAKWVVVVDANDTGDNGTGEVYKVEDGKVVGVDTKVGYGGANGNDVTGYIRDEYGLDCYRSWEA